MKAKLTLCFFAAAVVGCGGKVVFDAGSGGSGGSTTVSSSAHTTSATTKAVSSSASGPVNCAATTACSAFDGCIQCTGKGMCKQQVAACTANPGCSKFLTCLEDCQPGNDFCFSNCMNDAPMGQPEFQNVVGCAVCGACFSQCDGQQICTLGGD